VCAGDSLRENFKAMDVKNRCVITFGELKEGLRRYGAGLEDGEISDIMEVVSSCLVYTFIFRFNEYKKRTWLLDVWQFFLFSTWFTVIVYCFQEILKDFSGICLSNML
jgi:hypothetical protein